MQNFIRKARLSRHPRVTQAKLAEAIGIHRTQVSQIENSYYIPSLRLALKISEILKVPINDLFVLEPSDWEK